MAAQSSEKSSQTRSLDVLEFELALEFVRVVEEAAEASHFV